MLFSIVLDTRTYPLLPRNRSHDRRSPVPCRWRNCQKSVTVARYEGGEGPSEVQEFATFVASPNRREAGAKLELPCYS